MPPPPKRNFNRMYHIFFTHITFTETPHLPGVRLLSIALVPNALHKCGLCVPFRAAAVRRIRVRVPLSFARYAALSLAAASAAAACLPSAVCYCCVRLRSELSISSRTSIHTHIHTHRRCTTGIARAFWEPPIDLTLCADSRARKRKNHTHRCRRLSLYTNTHRYTYAHTHAYIKSTYGTQSFICVRECVRACLGI